MRKIVVARDKLRPLNERELDQKHAVLHQEAASVRCASMCIAPRALASDFASDAFCPCHPSSSSSPQGARGAAPGGPPDTDVVFSQVRNNRFKRLEESLNLNFDINAEDEQGNTLLLVACQNANKRMSELLIHRRAHVNHQNAHGNTALHFAMAYDTSGELGELLIEKGADDTIENMYGLSPYDGLTIDDQ